MPASVGLPLTAAATLRRTVTCKRKNVPFRLNRPYPDPPTLAEWKAPPVGGTEQILRRAFARKRTEKTDSDGSRSGARPFARKKASSVPWVLDVDFESDEELWLFLDGLDLKELRRQKVKFELPNYNDELELKKALFLLVKHQEIYRDQADTIMERRLVRANVQAEHRARRRQRRLRQRAKHREEMSDLEDDPFGDEAIWIDPRDLEQLGTPLQDALS